MSRFAQTWPSSLVGDLTAPQLWVIYQSPAKPTDVDPDPAALVVVLLDFSRQAADRATFALLGHAWAGATAVQALWSPDNLEATLRPCGDKSKHLLGVVLHVPMKTPVAAVEQALHAVHAALPGVCLIVTDEQASVTVTGATAIVRSTSGRSAVDALAITRMMVSLASPNDWVCLDVEDVRTVCASTDESTRMPMRLMSATWQIDTGEVVLASTDAEVLARAESVWLHVDAWQLKGDTLRQILFEVRKLCHDDVTLVFNSPFCHSLIAAWGGNTVQFSLLVR